MVLATEKKLRSSLIDEATVQKISLLTPNVGVAYSGMGPDSRLLVRKSRKNAQVPRPGANGVGRWRGGKLLILPLSALAILLLLVRVLKRQSQCILWSLKRRMEVCENLGRGNGVEA